MTLSHSDIAVLRSKVAWRILPMAILLYFVAYLDRANVGFAKLRMAHDLGFSEEVFGLGIGIFFLGYLTLGVPGALLVERWSARKWFARILVTWGIARFRHRAWSGHLDSFIGCGFSWELPRQASFPVLSFTSLIGFRCVTGRAPCPGSLWRFP